MEKWKVRFLEEWDSFGEDGMEVDAFGLDESKRSRKMFIAE